MNGSGSFAVLACSLAAIVACAKMPAADESADARAAVAAVERFSAALGAGDLDAAAAVLDPDVVILEGGGAERSREEYLAGHAQADADFLRTAKVTPGARSAHASGDLAWVASESRIEIVRDGGPVVIDGAESMVLARGADGWRIVHIHWSSRARKANPG